MNLKSSSEWNKFCKGILTNKGKLPKDIPAYPRQTYLKKGWVSYGDWLGTGYTATFLRKFMPFKKARSFVRKLGLKSGKEWYLYWKGGGYSKLPRPKDIPVAANRTYAKDGWVSMSNWLGTGTITPPLKNRKRKN